MAMEKDVWNDISIETERTYIYPDYSLTIQAPKMLHVSKSSLGGHAHRLVDQTNQAYYITPGWRAITWKVPEGSPAFKF